MNSCPAPMMFQCSNAVSTAAGQKTSAAESTASTSRSLSSPELSGGGLIVWSAPFCSPGAGATGSFVRSIWLHRKCIRAVSTSAESIGSVRQANTFRFHWGGAMIGRFIGAYLLHIYSPGKVLASAAPSPSCSWRLRVPTPVHSPAGAACDRSLQLDHVSDPPEAQGATHTRAPVSFASRLSGAIASTAVWRARPDDGRNSRFRQDRHHRRDHTFNISKRARLKSSGESA